MNKIWTLLLNTALIIFVVSITAAASADDRYIEGYAAAVLEREFHISPGLLEVENGTIILKAGALERADRGEIIDALSGIEGVSGVEILEKGSDTYTQVMAAGQYPQERPMEKSADLPEQRPAFGDRAERKNNKLFDSLMADPRWPNFSGAYHYYLDDGGLESVFAASVGDVVPLYTDDVPFAFGGRWQVGGEAGAFVIHDLDTSSWDQVNADYKFGFMAAYRKDSLSGIFRVFHQSSHIGDEYLLHNDVRRENYSYEALGLLVSKDMSEWTRVYGGGEYHFSRSPDELKPWVAQYGVELICPKTFLFDSLRPLVAADIKHKEDNDWSGEFSLRTGVRVENDQLSGHSFRLMLGYFNGHSPNGQFYKQSEEVLSAAFYYNY